MLGWEKQAPNKREVLSETSPPDIKEANKAAAPGQTCLPDAATSVCPKPPVPIGCLTAAFEVVPTG